MLAMRAEKAVWPVRLEPECELPAPKAGKPAARRTIERFAAQAA
jgi:hypothetical protein